MKAEKKRLATFVLYLISTAVLVAFDQWTKFLAVSALKGQEDIELLPGVLSLHYLENTGAAFGIFQDQRIFLLVLTTIIILCVCYVLWRIPSDRKYIFLKNSLLYGDRRRARQSYRPGPAELCGRFYLLFPD